MSIQPHVFMLYQGYIVYKLWSKNLTLNSVFSNVIFYGALKSTWPSFISIGWSKAMRLWVISKNNDCGVGMVHSGHSYIHVYLSSPTVTIFDPVLLYFAHQTCKVKLSCTILERVILQVIYLLFYWTYLLFIKTTDGNTL